MIISLIGFMGCGKSSVGRKLSQLLCCPFIDLDEAVEEVAGKRIPEIFASKGEAAFRRLETQILKDILSAEHERQCAPREVGRVNEIPMTPVCASRIHPLAGGGMSSSSICPFLLFLMILHCFGFISFCSQIYHSNSYHFQYKHQPSSSYHQLSAYQFWRQQSACQTLP